MPHQKKPSHSTAPIYDNDLMNVNDDLVTSCLQTEGSPSKDPESGRTRTRAEGTPPLLPQNKITVHPYPSAPALNYL